VIGFSSHGSTADEAEKKAINTQDMSKDDLLRMISPKDLVEFGLIPEFTGRLPVITTLEGLEAEDLVRILTEPKNALVRQYQSLFTMEEKELTFTKEALLAIAKEAIERETGVRALRSILESTLLDLLYELPNRTDTNTFEITEAHVSGDESLARGMTSEAPIVETPDEKAKRESA
jgi:ATP-dependent Clp protease ATP-binding subunit ClpX